MLGLFLMHFLETMFIVLFLFWTINLIRASYKLMNLCNRVYNNFINKSIVKYNIPIWMDISELQYECLEDDFGALNYTFLMCLTVFVIGDTYILTASIITYMLILYFILYILKVLMRSVKKDITETLKTLKIKFDNKGKE